MLVNYYSERGEVRGEERRGKIISLVKMRELGGVSYRIHCQQFTYMYSNTTLEGSVGVEVGG